MIEIARGTVLNELAAKPDLGLRQHCQTTGWPGDQQLATIAAEVRATRAAYGIPPADQSPTVLTLDTAMPSSALQTEDVMLDLGEATWRGYPPTRISDGELRDRTDLMLTRWKLLKGGLEGTGPVVHRAIITASALQKVSSDLISDLLKELLKPLSGLEVRLLMYGQEAQIPAWIRGNDELGGESVPPSNVEIVVGMLAFQQALGMTHTVDGKLNSYRASREEAWPWAGRKAQTFAALHARLFEQAVPLTPELVESFA